MSDLWKDHKPELTEEEDRLLWQRVRTIPLPPPDPWWKRLFAMPAVRYGAPALAVLVAAVVYVVERAPEPTLRPAVTKSAPERVTTAAPAPVQATAPKAATGTAQLMSERVLTERAVPQSKAVDRAVPPPAAAGSAPAEAPAQEDEVEARDERQQAERREATNFAQPPAAAALEKAKVAEPAPPPAPSAARKVETTAQSAPAPQTAQAPTWGAKKSQYLGVDQPPATGLTGLLAGSTLPSRSTLASHLVVVETAGPGALRGSVPLPDEPGARAVIALSPDAAPVARVESASLGLLRDVKGDGQYERYEDAPARLQAAALAAAFEKALASPKTTPRAKVEKLLVRARAVAAREDATPGAARLVTMIEGALRLWP